VSDDDVSGFKEAQMGGAMDVYELNDEDLVDLLRVLSDQMSGTGRLMCAAAADRAAERIEELHDAVEYLQGGE
jgi:hypothetical protein